MSLKGNNIVESLLPIIMFNDREEYSKETHIVKSPLQSLQTIIIQFVKQFDAEKPGYQFAYLRTFRHLIEVLVISI